MFQNSLVEVTSLGFGQQGAREIVCTPSVQRDEFTKYNHFFGRHTNPADMTQRSSKRRKQERQQEQRRQQQQPGAHANSFWSDGDEDSSDDVQGDAWNDARAKGDSRKHQNVRKKM